MKSFTILALGAGVVMAQSVSDLPQCGQTCINNMIDIASKEFGCSLGDAVCYCQEVNFGYGVRDCATQHCGADVAPAVIAFGASYCANVVASASTTGAAIAPLTSALATLPTTGFATATATGGEGQSTAITTSALVATVTGTDGSTFVTTTGFVTLYSSIDAAASSVSASIESAASSVSASLESVASSVSGSLASAASSVHASLSSVASSALASGASAASSHASGATGASSTGGAAPMMTGFPIVGAAGMAAWLLL